MSELKSLDSYKLLGPLSEIGRERIIDSIFRIMKNMDRDNLMKFMNDVNDTVPDERTPYLGDKIFECSDEELVKICTKIKDREFKINVTPIYNMICNTLTWEERRIKDGKPEQDDGEQS